MSQLNNDSDTSKDKVKKNKIEDSNTEKKENIGSIEKKKHPLRNTIIFLIIFTIVCVGITAVLIIKDNKKRRCN